MRLFALSPIPNPHSPIPKQMTEEHKQHMRESVLRRIAAMDEGKRTAFKEKCAANGRKSAAMMTPERRAALIAQTHTPRVISNS